MLVLESLLSQELGTLELSLPERQHLTFSKPLPPFSKTVPPSSIRDVISLNSINNQNSNSSTSRSIPTTNVMRGFGSDSFNNNRSGGRTTPVVLVPTNYANEGEERVDSFSGNGVGARGGGFRDLEDFYADDDVEERVEDDSEESESESEETASESEESRSERGSEEEDEEEESSSEEDRSRIEGLSKSVHS